MTVGIISWSISMNVRDQARIERATLNLLSDWLPTAVPVGRFIVHNERSQINNFKFMFKCLL